MKYNQIVKQAVDFQKTAFTNWCNAVAMIQDQSASAMEAMMSQANLTMPEEARRAVSSYIKACQEERKRFHSYVEGGISSLEKHFVQEARATAAEPPEPVVKEKKAAPAKSLKPAAQKKVAPARKTSQAGK